MRKVSRAGFPILSPTTGIGTGLLERKYFMLGHLLFQVELLSFSCSMSYTDQNERSNEFYHTLINWSLDNLFSNKRSCFKMSLIEKHIGIVSHNDRESYTQTTQGNTWIL